MYSVAQSSGTYRLGVSVVQTSYDRLPEPGVARENDSSLAFFINSIPRYITL